MKWIKIADRLPKEGEWVLTYFEHTGIDVMKRHKLRGEERMLGSNCFVGGGGFLTDDVTHWMPLPDKP